MGKKWKSLHLFIAGHRSQCNFDIIVLHDFDSPSSTLIPFVNKLITFLFSDVLIEMQLTFYSHHDCCFHIIVTWNDRSVISCVLILKKRKEFNILGFRIDYCQMKVYEVLHNTLLEYVVNSFFQSSNKKNRNAQFYIHNLHIYGIKAKLNIPENLLFKKWR